MVEYLKYFKIIIISGIYNWQTTILGVLGLIHAIVKNFDLILNGSNYERLDAMLPHIGVFLLALFAKDASITGVIGINKNDTNTGKD